METLSGQLADKVVELQGPVVTGNCHCGQSKKYPHVDPEEISASASFSPLHFETNCFLQIAIII